MKNSISLATIKLSGAMLAVGETTYNEECPACKGKSFSITKVEDTVLYNCFRAACGYSGRVGGVGYSPTRPSFVPSNYMDTITTSFNNTRKCT